MVANWSGSKGAPEASKFFKNPSRQINENLQSFENSLKLGNKILEANLNKG